MPSKEENIHRVHTIVAVRIWIRDNLLEIVFGLIVNESCKKQTIMWEWNKKTEMNWELKCVSWVLLKGVIVFVSQRNE